MEFEILAEKRNIALFKVFMAPEAKEEVGKVLESGYVGQGPKVEEFEKLLKERFGTNFLVTTNSATSAEHLAWLLLQRKSHIGAWGGFEEGDEVLSPPLSCSATNFPTILSGLKIKWIDVDPKTLNIDLDDLERKISPRTKAIMLVHWGGYPNDMDRIKEIQKKTKEMYGFKPAVVEDCAHALGSRYKGKLVGTLGNLATFSFQAIKHINSSDGGLLISPHEELYKRSKLLRWYGISREETGRTDFRIENDIEEVGTKWHMNDVAAQIGICNLKYADEIINKHKANAKFYDENLKDIAGLTIPARKEGFDSAFWIYSILVEDRLNFHKWMKECGIVVSQVHERNDKYSCMKEFKSHLPALDQTIGRLTHIPVHWAVTEEERQYIVDQIRKGW